MGSLLYNGTKRKLLWLWVRAWKRKRAQDKLKRTVDKISRGEGGDYRYTRWGETFCSGWRRKVTSPLARRQKSFCNLSSGDDWLELRGCRLLRWLTQKVAAVWILLRGWKRCYWRLGSSQALCPVIDRPDDSVLFSSPQSHLSLTDHLRSITEKCLER